MERGVADISDLASAMARKILLDRYGLLVGYGDLVRLRQGVGHVTIAAGWEGAAVTYLISYIRLFLNPQCPASLKLAEAWVRIAQKLVDSSSLSNESLLRLKETVAAHFHVDEIACSQ